MGKRQSEEWCTTDGTFFEDMRAMERKILAEIDPEALVILDQEEEEMEREYQEEPVREREEEQRKAAARRRRP